MLAPLRKMEKDEIAHVEEAESGNSVAIQEDELDAKMNLQAYLALAVRGR